MIYKVLFYWFIWIFYALTIDDPKVALVKSWKKLSRFCHFFVMLSSFIWKLINYSDFAQLKLLLTWTITVCHRHRPYFTIITAVLTFPTKNRTILLCHWLAGCGILHLPAIIAGTSRHPVRWTEPRRQTWWPGRKLRDSCAGHKPFPRTPRRWYRTGPWSDYAAATDHRCHPAGRERGRERETRVNSLRNLPLSSLAGLKVMSHFVTSCHLVVIWIIAEKFRGND